MVGDGPNMGLAWGWVWAADETGAEAGVKRVLELG